MIDWQAVFIAYTDYIARMEGADYLWGGASDGVEAFVARLPAEARKEVRELIAAHREKRHKPSR